ncbi:hypothetical protein ACL02S_01300 [Nocardia sp. 004]
MTVPLAHINAGLGYSRPSKGATRWIPLVAGDFADLSDTGMRVGPGGLS